MPWTASGSASICPTVMRGLSELYGILEDDLDAPAHLAQLGLVTMP